MRGQTGAKGDRRRARERETESALRSLLRSFSWSFQRLGIPVQVLIGVVDEKGVVYERICHL
jgi:hypothetical protein